MFHCYSISYHHAPLEVRERLHFSSTDLAGEAVLISTCNRLELYTHSTNPEVAWKQLLAQKQISPEVLAPYTMQLSRHDAAHHLFEVTAGLKSMALGEPQILGQVTDAFETSQRLQQSGHQLSLLFRAAIHAAKRVQTETGINTGHVSLSSLGICQLEQTLGSLENRKILVVGAGEMGQAVIKGLDRRHLSDVTLVSRTYETARQLAEPWKIQVCPITQLKDILLQADIVFTTSSAPFPILTVQDIAPIIQNRGDLYIVDIAVPRDVEPQVGEIEGVHLYNLDDLQNVVDENRAKREEALPLARRIIDEELAKFWEASESQQVIPTIRQLRDHVEQIRQAELTRIKNRLPSEQQAEMQRLMEEFSYRFMNKVLHQPTQNLKVKATQGSGALFTSLTRDLFGLEDA